jgi:hypothetical protein
MTWFKVTLTHEQIRKGGLIGLSREVQSISQGLADTERFVVFIGKMTQKGVTLFFTPDSVPHLSGLLSRYDGELCEKPSIKDIDTVLSGDRDTALSLLLEE